MIWLEILVVLICFKKGLLRGAIMSFFLVITGYLMFLFALAYPIYFVIVIGILFILW